MIWPLLGINKRTNRLPVQRLRTTAVVFSSLQRQEVELSFVKREQWTEEQVGELPAGEHDYFDRKSGQLFNNSQERNNLYDVLAKAASAFANSGGGHLILGVKDDGTFDGVPKIFSGTTTTREWLEQKVPGFLDYALVDFRVHTVVRANLSVIPASRDLIIIDFGDSSLAPHQSRRHGQYFHRSGGHSIPAPHFYLELLRQRLTNPSLDFKLQSVDVDGAWRHEGSLILRIDALFNVENTGRIAAYKWALVARTLGNVPEDRGDDYLFGIIPGAPGRDSSIRIDDTILPGCGSNEHKIFGVRLRPTTDDEQGMRAELTAMLANMTLTLQLATEMSPGKSKEVAIGALFSIDKAIAFLKAKRLTT